MPRIKTIGTIAKKQKREFKVLSEEGYNKLSEEEKKEYEKELERHKEKQAREKAEKSVDTRIALLESALKNTPVAKRMDLTCNEIDATFVCPYEKLHYIPMGTRTIRYFYKGDLIQLNCHTVPVEDAPCVVVRNGTLFFASKIKGNKTRYWDLNCNCAPDITEWDASNDEYVGLIVNVIRNPQDLFKPTAEGKKQAAEE